MRSPLVTPLALGFALVACGTETEAPLSPAALEADLQAGKSSWEWSEPVWLGPVVNSSARDLNPELSPDGLSLYFTSFRDGEAHIWVSQRAGEGCAWGAPVKLGAPINTDEGFQASPDVSPDGHYLYFASAGHGGFGGTDLFISHRDDPTDDFGWGPPVNLGPTVNTELSEQGPQFSPAGGGELYFNRVLPPNMILVVPMTKDGRFRGEAELVDELNFPPGPNAEVTVRSDGREIMFWSGGMVERPGSIGGADIFAATRPNPHAPWSEPKSLGLPINHEGGDLVPTLSTDGLTMIFSTNRPGGLGQPDLWMSVRSPNGEQVPELREGGACAAP